MFKKIFGKIIGGLYVKDIGKERIIGKDNSYSISFENIKLPWKLMTRMGVKNILSYINISKDFVWDKNFISSELDGITQSNLGIGIFNLNHTFRESLNIILKEEDGIRRKDISKNTDDLLKMARVSETLQKTIIRGDAPDNFFSDMEKLMDSFFNLLYPKAKDEKRISLKTYCENYYGLESWLKIEQGVEGDQWLYNMFIPAGGIVYVIRSLVLFERLQDEIKTEIEQIVHSFRFEMVPIAIDALNKEIDKIK